MRRRTLLRCGGAPAPGGGRRVAIGLLALASSAALDGAAAGQERLGRPLVQRYTYRDYGADTRNWDVIQDERGVMYVANSAGVLEYDGSTWRLIELPSRLEARSLALEPGSRRLYVGGRGDFGYLHPDDAGHLQFVSLLPDGARHDPRFDLIFTVMVTRAGVYFQSREKLCRWSHERLNCEDVDGSQSKAFATGGTLYVHQRGVGLQEVVDGSLQLVPGGGRFADDSIAIVLSLSGESRSIGPPSRRDVDGGLLVGTPSFELFFLAEGAVRPFGAALRDRLRDDRLLGGTVLSDRSFALITLHRGVLIVDREGSVRHQLDESTGLPNAYVRALWPDRHGSLWVALQNGIGRVELASPYSVVDEGSGLEREWTEVIRHDDVVYARGYGGLFAASLSTERDPTPVTPGGHALRFDRVPGIDRPTRAFVTMGDTLLFCAGEDIYEIHNNRPRRVLRYASTPVAMYRSRSEPDRVYVGLVGGVASLRRSAGGWHDEGRIEGIDETITSIAEGPHGDVWLVAQWQRIIRLNHAPAPATARERARPYADKPYVGPYSSKSANLELTGRVSVREAAEGVLFLSEEGIYTFDYSSDQLVPAPAFAAVTAAGRRAFSHVAEDAQGNVWVVSLKPGRIDFLRKQDAGSYVLDNAAVRQVVAWSVYPEPTGRVAWFCTPDHLLRYSPSGHTPLAADAATLIRRVVANGDTVIYGGAPRDASTGRSTHIEAASHRRRLPYWANSLRFEFTLPVYPNAEQNEFQVYLEGFDETWSDWRQGRDKRYAKLPEGDYRFHVRGRDVRDEVGTPVVFAFSIRPPWYRSWLAYGAIGSLLFGLLVLLRRVELNRARLRHQRELEGVELEKLRELDRLKSRFFADISHEFRTPITLILAPVEHLLQEGTSPAVEGRLNVVRRNAQRLLRLVGELFDLAKLETGKMRLQLSAGDLVLFVETSVAQFREAAWSRGIELAFHAPGEQDGKDRAVTYFDAVVLEKILSNLLWNALKFTPAGGTVSVTVRDRVPGASGSEHDRRDGHVEIAVSDTGIGVPPEYLPRIFDRFYQVEGTPRLEGIGIGLALVKELVGLHRGSIRADSVEGKGTTFVVHLPAGLDSFHANEIVRARSSQPREPRQLDLSPSIVECPDDSSCASDPVDAGEDVTTVLVVEDHPEMRSLLQEHLQGRYNVIEAPTAQAGLEKAIALLPDLVLSDVMMPGMNGYELCRALKTDQRTSHIPVLLLTARAGQEDKLLSLETGADQYMTKPFEPLELLMQVENLIKQRRHLRERFSGAVILKPTEMSVVSADKAFLDRLLTTVEEHVGDMDFDVGRLAHEVGFSRSQLHRKVRALTNQSPTMLIRSIRLHRAAQLLGGKAGSVAEIAYLVGFKSQSHFGESFREQFGCSPTQYAQQSERRRA